MMQRTTFQMKNCNDHATYGPSGPTFGPVAYGEMGVLRDLDEHRLSWAFPGLGALAS